MHTRHGDHNRHRADCRGATTACPCRPCRCTSTASCARQAVPAESRKLRAASAADQQPAGCLAAAAGTAAATGTRPCQRLQMEHHPAGTARWPAAAARNALPAATDAPLQNTVPGQQQQCRSVQCKPGCSSGAFRSAAAFRGNPHVTTQHRSQCSTAWNTCSCSPADSCCSSTCSRQLWPCCTRNSLPRQASCS